MVYTAGAALDWMRGAMRMGSPAALGVDGGLAGSDVFLQIQADLLGQPVRRHALREATAAGAAICAARGAGMLGADEAGGFVAYARTFEPQVSRDQANARFDAWKRLVYG
jgi:glycerol kinase